MRTAGRAAASAGAAWRGLVGNVAAASSNGGAASSTASTAAAARHAPGSWQGFAARPHAAAGRIAQQRAAWSSWAAGQASSSSFSTSLSSSASLKVGKALLLPPSAAAAAPAASCRGNALQLATLRRGVRTTAEQQAVNLRPRGNGESLQSSRLQGRTLPVGVGDTAAARASLWRRIQLQVRSLRPLDNVKKALGSVTARIKLPKAVTSLKDTTFGRMAVAAWQAMTQPIKGAFASLVHQIKSGWQSIAKAVSLQVSAFWQRHFRLIVLTSGIVFSVLLWQVFIYGAGLFVNVAEILPQLGFMALAGSFVLVAVLILKRLHTVDPDVLYRKAMRRLNTSPETLEVLGPPITGTDVRAYVMSGGGLRLKHLWPRLLRRRAHLIFPIKGSEHRGLVSVEAKKRKGRYIFKLLAVDVPAGHGKDNRIYLEGSQAEYERAGGLISELRDPLVKAMAAEREYEQEDEVEDEQEEKQEEEAARQAEEDLKLERTTTKS